MKTCIALVVALLIVGTGAYPQERTAATEPLVDFAAFAEDEQLEINEWSMTIKEQLNDHSVEELITIMNDFYKMEPIKEQNVHATNLIWKNSHKGRNFVESFNLIVPNDSDIRTEVVYSLKGEGTSFIEQEAMESLQQIKSRFFSKNVTIFSCLKAEYSGIMNDVLVYKKFKQRFAVTTIEEVNENGWISRSGSTNKWSQSIPLLNEEMNVQFASRTLGGRTNITIGTPIITAEY